MANWKVSTFSTREKDSSGRPKLIKSYTTKSDKRPTVPYWIENDPNVDVVVEAK